VAKIVGTIGQSEEIIASWHLTPLLIENPEVILWVTGGYSTTVSVTINVYADFNPDIDYQAVVDWSQWRQSINFLDGEPQGIIVATELCYAGSSISIPLRKTYGLVSIGLVGSRSNIDYELYLVCEEKT